MKNRVMLIMPGLFVGGAEKQYRYIMESICEEFSVTVLLLNRPLLGHEIETESFIKEHGDIDFVQLNGDALNKEKSGIVIRKISKFHSLCIQHIWLRLNLKKYNVDIVMFSYLTQLLETKLFCKNHVKVVFNERNTGRQICDKDYKIKLLKQCNQVVCNSKYASSFLNEKANVSSLVINNGIVFTQIDKVEHNKYVILIPARVNKIKNQKIVVESLIRLKEKHGSELVKNINCIFAGSIEDLSYQNEMVELITGNNLDVVFSGFVGNIKELYSKTDLIILPSLEEGTPNILLEAYAYSIPRLISDIPMNRDCIIDSDELFNPNSSEELACKIFDKMQNQGSVNSCKELKYLIDNYGIEKMKATYLKVINEVI